MKFVTPWHIDLVFCVDATGSMQDNLMLTWFQNNAVRLCKDLEAAMVSAGKTVAQLRARVIAYRDYLADGDQAMMATDFYLLPQQTEAFEACIKSIHADGGGDIPEDGLEALAYAMGSDWTTGDRMRRHVIMVLTDAGTHELGFGARSPYYPKDMPKNLSELEALWDAMNDRAKRLIICAPKEKYWNYISEYWECSCHLEVEKEVTEDQYQYALKCIVSNI